MNNFAQKLSKTILFIALSLVVLAGVLSLPNTASATVLVDCTDISSDGITDKIISVGSATNCTIDGTNDEVEIQYAIDNAVAGDTVQLNSNATISNTIWLNNSNIIFKGLNSGITINNTGNSTAIMAYGVTNDSWRSWIAQEAQPGQPNVTVQSGAVFNVGDEVIIEEYDIKTEDYRNTTVEINNISAINGNVLTMQKNLSNLYHVKSNSGVSRWHMLKNSVIRDLKIINNKSLTLASGIRVAIAYNFTVDNVAVENSGADGIWFEVFVLNSTIANSSFLNSTNVGVHFTHDYWNTLSNTTIKQSLKNVVAEQSYDDTFTGNRIENSTSNAMELYVGCRNNVKNNIIINSGAAMGVDLRYQCNDTIQNNTLFNNWYGIKDHEHSDNNIIKNNLIMNSGQYGIYESNYPSDLAISPANVTYNIFYR